MGVYMAVEVKEVGLHGVESDGFLLFVVWVSPVISAWSRIDTAGNKQGWMPDGSCFAYCFV